MMKKHIVVVSMVFLFCFAAIPVAFANVENSPQVKINFDKATFGFDENVPVRVTISNTSDDEIKILRWLTPIDGVKGDIFSVTIDGNPAQYTGALFKRAAPTENDYIKLKAGETIIYTVNLADYYDLSQSGDYQISYRAENYDSPLPESLSQRRAVKLQSESVSVWIFGTQKLTQQRDIPTDDYTTTGCTSAQMSSLPASVNGSAYYAINSYNYLNAGTVDSRYTSWFGANNSTRYSTARTHFLNIRNLIDTGNFRIVCSDPNCPANTYAFVFPSDTTHSIHVCNVFWSASTLGTDSKAGTLIHEMSHFSDIAATSDFAYGQSAARNLAVSNPNNAVSNADNHEYFAEASPTTAAAVTISGRVLSTKNRGVSNAKITLLTSSGSTISTQSTAFGYYRFTNVGAGQTCILSANSKRSLYESKALFANEDLSNINLTAVAAANGKQ